MHKAYQSIVKQLTAQWWSTTKKCPVVSYYYLIFTSHLGSLAHPET